MAGEGAGECGVELEHPQQRVSPDHVEVAVGEGTHVGRRSRRACLLPEHVPKHIAFTWYQETSNLPETRRQETCFPETRRQET